MRQLNIDPKKLARRLLFMHHWAVYEHVTFHADPHPANIVVRANNTLVFVDFGTNGHITKERRELFSRFYTCLATHDVWGMAQATIALLEPLPARDLNSLAKAIEAAYYERLLAVKSKYSNWHERTSVAMWLATFQIIRAQRIKVPMDVLSYVRATLFYDTLAARLWPEIDYFKEFKRYRRDAQKRQRKQSMKRMRRRLRDGLLTDRDFATLEKAGSTVIDLIFRLQRLMAVPYDFAVITLTIEKWVVTVVTVLKFAIYVTILTGLGLLVVIGFQAAAGQSVMLNDSLQLVFTNRLYQTAIAILALLNIRIILFRLADKTRKE
jgi:predicted unusual protein kinase regulating ubiquinone biosynthesis (AarF/ABC1/UbiB family)